MGGAEHYLSIMAAKNENGRGPKFSRRKLLIMALQLFHLVLGAGIVVVGIIEFSAEPSLFDVFGKKSEERSIIPDRVFPVSFN